LANDLPGTVHIEGKARVVYEVHVEVVFPSCPSCHVAEAVFVRAALPAPNANLANSNNLDSSSSSSGSGSGSGSGGLGVTARKTFLLHPKSPLVVVAVPDRAFYLPVAHALRLDVSLSNNSFKTVSRLVISLQQHIKYANIKADSLPVTLTLDHSRFPVPPQSKYEELVTIDLPHDLIPTTKGVSINASHRLELRFDVCVCHVLA
jgi:hypothetical protein